MCYCYSVRAPSVSVSTSKLRVKHCYRNLNIRVKIFAYKLEYIISELNAALTVQHVNEHFLFHLLSALNAESSLNPVQMCFS